MALQFKLIHKAMLTTNHVNDVYVSMAKTVILRPGAVKVIKNSYGLRATSGKITKPVGRLFHLTIICS